MSQKVTDAKSGNRKLIFVIGCPGAGKGTLCSKLAEQHGWTHISVGHELRKYVRHHDQPDDLVVQCVRAGQLVPEQALVEILQLCISQSAGSNGAPIVLDGIPRHAGQIPLIQDQIGVPDRVICFECPKEIARDRVLTRKDASRVDNEEIFERRYTEFCSNNPDILAYFEAQEQLIKVDTRHHEDLSFSRLMAELPDYLLNTNPVSHQDTTETATA